MLSTSFRAQSPIHLLLGSVKHPRGLGSQHLATVNVMGLKARVCLVRAGCVEAKPSPFPVSQKYLPSPPPMPSIPWFVYNFPKYSNRIIVTHVLKVDLVYLGNRSRRGICSCVGEMTGKLGREAKFGGLGGLPHTKKQDTEGADISPSLSIPPPRVGNGTCNSMSPGSMRPSAATAPPFMMEPM